MKGDPTSRKWLETRSYQEPEVRIRRAHNDQDTQYHDDEPEKRYPEIRKPLASATRKFVPADTKSLIATSTVTNY